MGNIETPHLREYGFRKYPKYVCLWNPESGKFQNLGFEMWNTAQGIRNPTKRWNLQSEIYWESIRYPRRRIRNQRLSWVSFLGDCISVEFLKRFILTVFQSFSPFVCHAWETHLFVRCCDFVIHKKYHFLPCTESQSQVFSKKKSFWNNVRLKNV